MHFPIFLYSNCIPVKGFARSVIYDTQNRMHYLIPNDLYDLLSTHNGQTIDTIKSNYNDDDFYVIDEYISFLIKNKIAFFNKSIDNFLPLSNSFISSSIISNAIIELGKKTIPKYREIIEELDQFGCQALSLHFIEVHSINEICNLLKLTNQSRITHIEVFIDNILINNETDFDILFQSEPRIKKINISKAKKNDIIQTKFYSVYFSRYNLMNNNSCGNIHPILFKVNGNLYRESIHFNNCLNKKLSINLEGYIKNCPSMKHHYGHINNTKIEDIIKLSEFKKCWHYKKDDIDVCNICEFRYMCIDCRAYIKDPNNIYSQPAKCGYNPYIAKWESQEGWVSVEEWRKRNPDWEKSANKETCVNQEV